MLVKELLPTLQPRILNIGYKVHGTEWFYQKVISPFSRLYLITKGEAFVNHHDREYRLTEGDIHIVPCFTLCDYHCPDSFEICYIHFTSRISSGMDIMNVGHYEYQHRARPDDRRRFERLIELLPGREIDVCMPHDIVQKREFLKKLREETFEGSAGQFLESDGIFRCLLAPFMDTLFEQEELPPPAITKVMKFIEANLHRQLSLDDLGHEAGLHPTYLSDLFVKLLGVRPIEYINRKRIEKAQLMIVTNAGSLKEIADQLGFSDSAYFSRTFKKYAGSSPSKYLANMRI